MTATVVVLDWSKHRVGQAKPCRVCGRDTWMRDETDTACHKVCAEREASS